MMYDGMIAPPTKTAIFCKERFMAARHAEGRYEKKKSSYIFLFAKD